MVAPDRLDVDAKVWDADAPAVMRAAAEDPMVTRIFVNAAIKKEMCSEAGSDRAWLGQGAAVVGTCRALSRPLSCPPDSPQCKPQPPVPEGDGCGHALDFWFKESTLHPAPPTVPLEAGAVADARRPAGGVQADRDGAVRSFRLARRKSWMAAKHVRP